MLCFTLVKKRKMSPQIVLSFEDQQVIQHDVNFVLIRKYDVSIFQMFPNFVY